jgi:hypothetical protein
MDIELAKAVEVIRAELVEAAWRGRGQQVGFVVGPIEMEFAVELKVDAKAKAGFKALVVASVDAETGVMRGRTHKVKVTVTPKGPDGTDLWISDEGAEPGPGDRTGHSGR